MKRTGLSLYILLISLILSIPEWELIYFLEAIDLHCNGCMIPDLEIEAPIPSLPMRQMGRDDGRPLI